MRDVQEFLMNTQSWFSRQQGVIRQSEDNYGYNRDAAFGSGTYLTKIPPSQGRNTIFSNNYDGMGEVKFGLFPPPEVKLTVQ